MRYGLVGKNLTYSFSKLIHEYLYREYNIDATYDLIELDFFNKDILSKYDGVNVTTPYKLDALNSFENDNLVTCNTITSNRCYNTDKDGLVHLFNKVDHEINKIVILGAGAIAKLVESIFECEVEIIETLNIRSDIQLQGDVLVNANPVGMNEYKCVVSKDVVKNFKTVIDLNYNPINSLMKCYAIESNVNYIGGMEMLIVQAIKAFEIFTNISVEKNYIKKIKHYIYKSLNLGVVIVGMPLAGKTTLGKEFAAIDIDEKIIEEYGDIETLIRNEDSFREIEHKVIEKYSGERLLCLGGGAVTYFQNYELLKNKVIIFLNTSFEELQRRSIVDQRPLIKTENDLKELYETRIRIYKQLCNEEFDSDQTRRFLNEYFSY